MGTASLPAWGVRVEIFLLSVLLSMWMSLPAWGVRVEIQATGLPSRDRRHSPHGECGLKSAALAWIIATWARHSPHGECGLKSVLSALGLGGAWSLPAWGVRVEIEEFRPYRDPSASLPAWGVRVEISCTQRAGRARGGHSPCGECGLKLHTLAEDAQHRGHSPHGECGLKYVDLR